MRERILLIEDDPALARLVQKKLHKAGYVVDIARNGEEGLARYAAGSYGAVIVDYSLPGRDGLEVVRQLAAGGRLPPTMMVTASGNEKVAVAAMKLGIGDYIVKDIGGGYLDLLPVAMERVLQQHRLVQEKQQAEEALRASEEELARAQRLKSIGQLAAGIAHEISTPTQYVGDNTHFLQKAFGELTGLTGQFGHLLEAVKAGTVTQELVAEVEAAVREADLDYLGEEVPKAIRQSLNGIEQIASIVHAVQEFSHPGEADKQAVDLNRAVENTLTVSRNQWKYVAEMVTDLDRSLGPVVCQVNDFNWVVLNLVINAAQAIAEVLKRDPQRKGTITVSTRRHGDWAEVRVADTGTGIPEEHRSKVFEPFFTTRNPGEGTGQGLAVAHAIVVQRHGGSITFDTEVGRGTTFVVRLPTGDPSGPRRNSPNEEVEAVC